MKRNPVRGRKYSANLVRLSWKQAKACTPNTGNGVIERSEFTEYLLVGTLRHSKKNGAPERIRTSTTLRPQGPEPCVYANFTTGAIVSSCNFTAFRLWVIQTALILEVLFLS